MNTSKKALVIDDDQKFSFGLVSVLRKGGYHVITASNGTEGLNTIRAEKPDIILCDIMMPPPNGLQLRKELENDPQLGRIPFLFLTARTAPMDKLAGLENGADDYVTKPFEVNELLARIQSVLRRDELGRQRGVQEANESIDRLRTSISTNLSHEMRTPLTNLLMTLDLVVREKFTESNEELNQYVQRATGSANRIKFLVEDLEMLYDIDQRSLSTLRQPVELRSYFKTPIDQIMKSWETKHLDLQVNIAPGVALYAPRKEFSHVLAHLVDNACKFSPENGKVTISLWPNGLGGCILEVIDEGAGISFSLREKVFERYFQVSQGDTRKYAGLGVGLTIARAFFQAMHGEIQIMDNPYGCRIRMVLPPCDLD